MSWQLLSAQKRWRGCRSCSCVKLRPLGTVCLHKCLLSLTNAFIGWELTLFVCRHQLSHLCYGIEIYGNTYHSYLYKLIILNNKILRILQNESYRTHVAEFYETITPFQFQNSTIIELCHWFINLPTITANYLLYFQHILMIINYFMNIIFVGKIASPNWLPYIYWTQMYKI